VILGAVKTGALEAAPAAVEEDAAAAAEEEEEGGELGGGVVLVVPLELDVAAPLVTGGVLRDGGLAVEVVVVVSGAAACADATGTAAVGRIKLNTMAMAEAHDQTRDRRVLPVACRVSSSYIRVLLAVVRACAIVRVLLCCIPAISVLLLLCAEALSVL
jgi:hypothetical protein